MFHFLSFMSGDDEKSVVLEGKAFQQKLIKLNLTNFIDSVLLKSFVKAIP